MEEAALATHAQQVAHYSGIKSRLYKSPNALKAVPVPPVSPQPIVVAMRQGVMEFAPTASAPLPIPAPAPITRDERDRIMAALSADVPHLWHPRRRERSPQQIIRETAQEYHVTVEDIVGARRSRDLIMARHRAIWRVCVACTKLSLQQVGERFGNRDHTTILHAFRKTEIALRRAPAVDRHEEFMRWTGCCPAEARWHFAHAEPTRAVMPAPSYASQTV